MAKTSQLSPAEAVQRAAQAALDLKANDVVILNLKGVSDVADFFVIASGTSDTHVRAVAQHVDAELSKLGVPALHEEGVTQGRWALLDYFDFVVHVFHPSLRQFYQLERLWSDAEVVPVRPQQSAPAGAQ